MLPYCNPPLIFAAMKTFILQQVKCCHLYLLLFLNLSSSFISTSVIISHTFFFTTNGCRLLICTALPWCQMSLLLLSSLYTRACSKNHSINDGKTQQTPDFLPTLTFSDLPFLFLSDFSIYPPPLCIYFSLWLSFSSLSLPWFSSLLHKSFSVLWETCTDDQSCSVIWSLWVLLLCCKIQCSVWNVQGSDIGY